MLSPTVLKCLMLPDIPDIPKPLSRLSLLTACGNEAESTTQAETTTEVVTEEVTVEAETANDATEKADNASESDTV